MEFIYIAIGLVFGLFIGYIILNRKQMFLVNEKHVLSEKLSISNEKNKLTDDQLLETKENLHREREKTEKLSISLASSETELVNLQEKITKQKTDTEELHKKLTLQFNQLAQKIFDEKSKTITSQNKEQLELILNPLNEKLKGFEQKIEDTYIKNVKDRSNLQAEIKKLIELNSKISDEANSLTKALKGDVKKQGNWGELILERILEHSGLQKNREFKTQLTLNSESGAKYMPDVVVFLPENKHIIIDSKVSLIAYEQFTNAQTKADKDKFIKEHLLSLKNHIKQLSDKQYYKLNEVNSPEYVLLFIPIEASFSVAVNEDKSIFNFAWDNKIVLVSPSTLIATLLTVSSIWRQENQTKNALEIAKKSGDLYDKFVSLTENVLEIGTKLKQTQNAYDSTLNKLSQGKGNLIKRVEDIKKLGAKASKSIPDSLSSDFNND